MGPRHLQVIAIRADLAAVNQQINAEAEHVLGNMKNSYDIAVRQEQSQEVNLQSLTAHVNSEVYVKLQQLQRVADADRNLYNSYLSQFNDISERRTLQDASARIISPATLPRSPSSPRRKLFYVLGGWRVSVQVFFSPSCWNIFGPVSGLAQKSSNLMADRSLELFLWYRTGKSVALPMTDY